MASIFFKSLKHHWIEYLLTVVIIAIVVSVVSVQRALSKSSENEIHSLAHELGSNMLVLPEDTDLESFYRKEYGKEYLADDLPDKIAQSKLSSQIKSIDARLYGNLEIDDANYVFLGFRSLQGGQEVNRMPPEVLFLGKTSAELLKKKESDSLLIEHSKDEHLLEVNGVLNRPPEGLDIGLFSSLETSQKVLHKDGRINAMWLSGCWCSTDIAALGQQVEELFPGVKAITVSGMLKAQKGSIAVVKRYASSTYIVAALLIGIIVTALISSQIQRQKKEIGLLLAIGTPPFLIILFFTLTAGVLGIVGGLAGFFLGFPLTNLAAGFLGISLSQPTLAPALFIIPAFVICTVAAVVPAIRTAKLDPTLILSEV